MTSLSFTSAVNDGKVALLPLSEGLIGAGVVDSVAMLDFRDCRGCAHR